MQITSFFKRALFGGLVFFLCVVCAGSTEAQTSTAPSPSSVFAVPSGSSGGTGDAPIQWLQNIFLGTTAPETFLSNCQDCQNDNASGYLQTGVATLLSWYSEGMLVLASFILFYYLLRTIAETAHTGKPGGRANQLWGPIRMVVAIGLLVPLPSGLNSGQMIIVNLASEGSALASNAWAAFSNQYILNTASTMFAAPSPSDEDQVVQNLVLIYVCEDYINASLGGAGIAGSPDAVNPTTQTTATQTTVSWGNQNDPTLCGTVKYSTGLAGGASAVDTAIYSAVLSAKASALGTAMGAAQTAAQTYVNAVYPSGSTTAGPALAAAITSAIQAYNSALASDTSSALSTASSAVAAAMTNSLGWLSAGSMFLTVARLQNDIDSASSTMPITNGPDKDTIAANARNFGGRFIHNLFQGSVAAGSNGSDTPPLAVGSDNQMYEDLEGALRGAVTVVATAPASSAPGAGGSPVAPVISGLLTGTTPVMSGSGIGGFVETVVGKVLGVAGGSILAGVPLKGFPITALQNLGWTCIKAAIAIYGIGSIIGIFSGAIGSLGVLFGSVLFAPGILLCYVLPLLPFIRFLFAIFGWLLAYAEAVISVPIFALAHLDPEGEGVLPQMARQGYLLLLQLLFRPLLIVIGLVIAILLMNGMFDFLNAVWMATVINANGTSSMTGNGASNVGAFSLIVYGVIYAGVVYTMCNMCFKAIDYIPNSALRWIGASGDHHNSEHGPHIEKAALVTAVLGDRLGQSAGNIGSALRQRDATINQSANKMASDAYDRKLAEYNANAGVSRDTGEPLPKPSYSQEFEAARKQMKSLMRSQSLPGRLWNRVKGGEGT